MKKTLLKNEIGNTLSPITEMDSVVDSEGRLLPDVLSGYDRKINSATKKADAALSHLAQKADKDDVPEDFFVVNTGMTYEEVEEAYQKHGFKMVLLKDDIIYPLVSSDREEYIFACSKGNGTIVWYIDIRGIWSHDENIHESKKNKVASLSSSSNHFTYPSAKAVYDAVQNRVMVVNPRDIMEYHTDDLSSLTSLIYVQNNARILPVTLDGRGWLYEWQNGWRIADVSDFTATNKNWYDFLAYMNRHSVPLGGGVPTISVNEEGDTTTISGDVLISGDVFGIGALFTTELSCKDDDDVQYNVGNEIRDLKQGGSGGGTEYIIRRWN